MKRFIILAAVSALTVARPDLYREQEDFKYSRSSSDDGHKSGFYDAQRGNMGGNYERAHNMDSLAQHQMSGLVNQVDGELGEGAKTRTGSVYTSANTRGIYGSGNYDLSNLAGRNFQEGSFSDSQSRSSSSQSATNNAAYTSRYHNSRNGGYQAAGHTGQSLQTGDLQSLDDTQSAGTYGYGQQSSSGYNSQSGYHSSSSYGNSDSNSHSGNYDGTNVRTRLISAVPVRIVFRPGTRVAVPIGTQQTYEINQGAANYDASRLSSYDANQRSSSYDHSSVNSEAESLTGSGINTQTAYKPKHYESSYSYRKEWERHNTVPPTLIVPTESPTFHNSELYDDSQTRTLNHQSSALASDAQTSHSRNSYTGYNANVKSSSSQSRYRSGLNSQQLQPSSGSDLNSYTQAGYGTGSNTDLNSQVESISSKPKSYHSSYSYHKSWERQGDPYVIQPASNGNYDAQSAQRLVAGTKSSYGSGSHHQSQIDCDTVCGHARVARSYDASQYQESQQSQNLEDLGQQSQNLEEFGQQSQKLEDFGQQSQNLEDFGQQSQNLGDFSQQSQNQENVGQQSQNLADFGQESQNLANFGQESQNLADFGQQSQDLAEFGQQNQNLGQQSQHKWDKLEDLGQQSQNTWENYEDLGQHAQNQNTWDKVDFGQQTRHNPEQNTQDKRNKLDNAPHDNQQTQSKWDLINTNEEQKITLNQNQDSSIHVPPHQWNQQESQFHGPDSFSQSTQNGNDDNQGHRVDFIWGKLNTETMQNNNSNAPTMQEQKPTNQFQNNNEGQEIQSISGIHNWNVPTLYDQNNGHELTVINGTHSQENPGVFSLWNKLDDIEKKLEVSSNTSRDEKYESSYQHTNAENTYQTSRREESYFGQSNVNLTHINNNFSSSINTHYTNKNKTNNVDFVQSYEDNEEKVRPQDIGRGDIGAEDLTVLVDGDTADVSSNQHNNEKPRNPIATADFNFNSANNKTVNKTQNEVVQREIQSIASLGQKINSTDHFPKQDMNNLGQERGQQDILQQNLNVFDLENQNQRNVQQSTQHTHGHVNENLGQQNLQHDKNVEQVIVQSFSPKHENIEQQNVRDLNENLGQQNVSVVFQGNNNREQQNLQDFSQLNENLEQQNIQNFDQQDENLDQRNVYDIGMQNKNLEQQNLKDFGHQDENLDQQNIQDFGQENIQDFGQQNENLDQQSVQDFGQLSVQDFGQVSVQDFGQASVQDFGQASVQDFGQASVQDFGQENIPEFSQKNQDLPQQNIHNFAQQSEYFRQHNLHDFSSQQGTNLDQLNIQDFGHQHPTHNQHFVQDSSHHGESGEHRIYGHNFGPYGHHHAHEHDNTNRETYLAHHDTNSNQYSEHHQWNYGQVNSEQQSIGQGRENYFPHGSNHFEPVSTGNMDQQQAPISEEENIEPLDKIGQEKRPHPEKMEVLPHDTQHRNLESIPPKNPTVETPPEPVTEKPGFWKSVGNKFVSAKDKVVSWFKS